MRRALVLGIMLLCGAMVAYGLGARWRASAPPTVAADAPTIVYLIDRAAQTRPTLRADSLAALVGARPVHEWEQLVTLDNAQPVDMVIIHESARKLVDPAWLSEAYYSGTPIAAINLYGPELAELIDDPCILADGFASDPYPDDFYVAVYRRVIGKPEAVARTQEAYRRHCGNRPALGGAPDVRIQGGRTTYGFAEPNVLEALQHTIRRYAGPNEPAEAAPAPPSSP